jgi:hypothetical protein
MSMDATPDAVIDYVRVAAILLDLPLDAAQIGRVAAQLARTRVLADALMAVPLQPHDELADIYCPAPFPTPEAAP